MLASKDRVMQNQLGASTKIQSGGKTNAKVLLD